MAAVAARLEPGVHHCATSAGTLRVRVADGFISRALGLLVGAPLRAAEGLLIAPCSSIHTIGMRYPIDVVFVARDARVLRVYPNVRAGRLRFAPGARGVLELRSGVAALYGLEPGVRLRELAAALGT
jgi:uncharacterized membrane protein (UPF0127 family)